MTKWLIRLFIKNPGQTKDAEVRERYGLLAGLIGIICNFILFIVKLIIGTMAGSVAIMADSFHNLADSSSAFVTILSFRFGSKPADKTHPFGHGRLEYVSALVIAFLIVLFGWEFLKESVTKIMHPGEVTFQLASVLILAAAMLVQVWMSFSYREIGGLIDSLTLAAMSREMFSDVLVTGVTILSVLFTHFTGVQIDGFAGLFVSLVLFKNGFDIAKETISAIMGEPADPALAGKIKKMVESYDGIIGSHDLMIHSYGPNRYIASIHAEVSIKADILASHEAVDLAEREIAEELGIILLIHMDPVDKENETIKKLSQTVMDVIARNGGKCSAHDFRLMDGKRHKNFIFDLVVPHEYTAQEKDKIASEIQDAIDATSSVYHCIINVEHGYVGV